MVSEQEKRIIRELQKNLPLVDRPYMVIAERLGISENELIKQIKLLKEKGHMRRLGAALRHREMGITANAMIVWQVPETECERVGKTIALFPEVTHCYQRTVHPKWSYNLFAMIHFPTKEECFILAEKISMKIGDYPFRLLFSSHELKKTSMKYFVEDM